MEGKKSRAAVTACCLLMVLLLSAQQQQVAAMSKFCRCYQKCYAECRKEDKGPYPCNIQCVQDCINGMLPPAPVATRANCGDICLKHICGVMETGVDAECVADCNKNMGAFAPGATKIN